MILDDNFVVPHANVWEEKLVPFTFSSPGKLHFAFR
jgi:hypothetical protein